MIPLLLVQVEWTERLRDDDIEARDEATRRLLELGEKAEPYLLDALRSGDSDVRGRAQWCLRVLDIRRGPIGRRRGVVPRTAELLAVGEPKFRARVFLELATKRDLTEEDLASIGHFGFGDVSAGREQRMLCHLIHGETLRSLRPILVEALGSDGEESSELAFLGLLTLGIEGLVSTLLELPVPDESMSWVMAEHLLRPGRDAYPSLEFARAIDLVGARGRLRAARLLGRADWAVRDELLGRLIADEEPEVRAAAGTALDRVYCPRP